MEAVVNSRRNIGIAVLVAGLVLVSGCGKGTTKQAAQSPATGASSDFTGNPDGPYCRAALGWAVVEMTPRNHDSVAGETKYWNDYAAFLKYGDNVAPAEIKSAFHAYANRGLNLEIPILRKYGFDKKRYENEATAAEKKRIEGDPSPEEQKAFSQVVKYEWQVCGSGTPDAATNVKFTGDKNSAYCKSEQASVAAFGKVRDAGFAPAVVKGFFTSKVFTEGIANLESVAPEAIRSDVAAHVNWIRTKQVPVLVKYGYDFKKIKLQGTPEERFASDTSAVEIRDVDRRLNAYDSQVCGI
jgi:hypothetical protein